MKSIQFNWQLLQSIFFLTLLVLKALLLQCTGTPSPRNYRVNGGTFMVPQHPDAEPYRNYADPEPLQNELPSIRSPKLRRAAILASKTKAYERRPYAGGVPILDHQVHELEQLSRAKRQASPQVQLNIPGLGASGSLNTSLNLGTAESPENSTSTAATTASTIASSSTTASTTAKQAPTATATTVKPTPGTKIPKGGDLYLPEDYNKLEIPKPNLGKAYGLEIYIPLTCRINLNILGVTEIDELSERITFDADLTVEWVDGNLFDFSKIEQAGTKENVLKAQKILSPDFLGKVWRPDLVMEDLVKVEQPTITNQAVIGLKFNTVTGFISYTVRRTITVNCPMSFEYYPADTQSCDFELKSYSYPNREMTLDWLLSGVFLRDPSESNFDLKVERVKKETSQPAFNNPLNDTFDSLKFSIRARRKISYHLVQTYLPSILHIFITWLVFLIPSSMYDLRVGTTMTTLLTLTAMFSSVRESAPVVSYVKAVDLWMITCVFFVFLNLVVLTLLTWLRVTAEGIQEKLDKLEAGNKENGTKIEDRHGSQISKHFSIPKNRQRMNRMWTAFDFMEDFSFCIFGVLFVVFNISYWSWLLTSSEYFEWDPNSEYNAIEL